MSFFLLFLKFTISQFPPIFSTMFSSRLKKGEEISKNIFFFSFFSTIATVRLSWSSLDLVELIFYIIFALQLIIFQFVAVTLRLFSTLTFLSPISFPSLHFSELLNKITLRNWKCRSCFYSEWKRFSLNSTKLNEKREKKLNFLRTSSPSFHNPTEQKDTFDIFHCLFRRGGSWKKYPWQLKRKSADFVKTNASR